MFGVPLKLNPYYSITSDGVLTATRSGLMVRSFEKSLAVRTDTYVNIRMKLGGKRNHVQLAFLLASQFVQNPRGFEFVKFKDGDRSNLALSNLTWVETLAESMSSAEHKEVAERREATTKMMREKRLGVFSDKIYHNNTRHKKPDNSDGEWVIGSFGKRIKLRPRI